MERPAKGFSVEWYRKLHCPSICCSLPQAAASIGQQHIHVEIFFLFGCDAHLRLQGGGFNHCWIIDDDIGLRYEARIKSNTTNRAFESKSSRILQEQSEIAQNGAIVEQTILNNIQIRTHAHIRKTQAVCITNHLQIQTCSKKE